VQSWKAGGLPSDDGRSEGFSFSGESDARGKKVANGLHKYAKSAQGKRSEDRNEKGPKDGQGWYQKSRKQLRNTHAEFGRVSQNAVGSEKERKEKGWVRGSNNPRMRKK